MPTTANKFTNDRVPFIVGQITEVAIWEFRKLIRLTDGWSRREHALPVILASATDRRAECAAVGGRRRRSHLALGTNRAVAGVPVSPARIHASHTTAARYSALRCCLPF